MPKTFKVTRRVGLMNRIATALLRIGLKPGLAYLLSVRGGKSGRMRSTPVSPLEYEGCRYLVAGSHQAEWVKNARAAGWAMLGRGRRSERVGLSELDQERAAPILKAFAKMVGGGNSFFEAGPDSSLEAFEVEAPYHPIFEIVALPEGSLGHDEPSVGRESPARPYEDRKRSRRREYRILDRTRDGPFAGLGRAGLKLLVGLVAPVALYYGLRAAGVGAYPALVAGAAAPALGAAIGLIRGGRVDGLMAFFTAMTLLSLGVSLVGGGPRFLLAREGWITGAAGVWFLASAWSSRPLALVFSRPLLERLFRYAPGRWDGLWDGEPRFRRVWRVTSVVFGVGLLADAAARVAMAYALPIDLVPILGTALHAATSVALLVIVNVYHARSGLYGMLRGGPPRAPATPTVRRLLYPLRKVLLSRGSRVHRDSSVALVDSTARREEAER